MNDIELEFFDDFCQHARSDSCYIGMAADLVYEMNQAMQEGRPINPDYSDYLAQFLALRDVLSVQQIEWFPKVK